MSVPMETTIISGWPRSLQIVTMVVFSDRGEMTTKVEKACRTTGLDGIGGE